MPKHENTFLELAHNRVNLLLQTFGLRAVKPGKTQFACGGSFIFLYFR
jgi:hypothetical protein